MKWFKSIERVGTNSELHLDLNRYVDKNIFHKNTDEALFACFNSLVEEYEEQLKEKERQEAEMQRLEQKKEAHIKEMAKEAMLKRIKKTQDKELEFKNAGRSMSELTPNMKLQTMKDKFAMTVGRELQEKLEFERMLGERGGLWPKGENISRAVKHSATLEEHDRRGTDTSQLTEKEPIHFSYAERKRKKKKMGFGFARCCGCV